MIMCLNCFFLGFQIGTVFLNPSLPLAQVTPNLAGFIHSAGVLQEKGSVFKTSKTAGSSKIYDMNHEILCCDIFMI